jgi:hypothetical protein
MNIETKYNIGDEFWIMVNNKPEKCIVNSITSIISNVPADYGSRIETVIHYRDYNNKNGVSETGYFSSKQALLNSL